MKVSTVDGHRPEQEIDVHIPLVFKVDKAKREIEGVATQEVTDVHGEIVDYESMKAVLADWPGNIREMHQAKAVGKALEVICDDANKAVVVRSRISKGAPDTWEKVLDGTLSMYSIGGKGVLKTQKNADGQDEKRIFMTKLIETSVVDNGACPTAKFDIVKMVDGAATHVQPEEPAEESAETTVVEGSGRAAVIAKLAELIPTFDKAPQTAAAAGALKTQLEAVSIDTVEKRSYPATYTIERVLCAISCLEQILAEEWWKVRDVEASDEDASVDRAQLQVLRNAIELVIAYLLSEFNAQFADMDAEASGIAMAALARRAELVEKAAFDLPVTFHKVDGMGQLWFAKAGARHSKADTQMVQAMHDTAVGLGAIDCAACHKAATEKAAGTPAAEPVVEKVEAPAAAAVPEAIAKDAEVQPEAPAAPVQEPAAPADQPIQQAAGLSEEAVRKLVADAVTKAVEAQKATSDAAIAELQQQITKLANEPVPGGPKARATGTEGTPVHKQLGNTQASPFDGVDPAAVMAIAEQLAKEATTQEERDRIARMVLRFQHATGAGASIVSQSTARRTE